MAFANLREFIAHLEKQGALRRVSAPVSRDLEIAEITDRVSKSAGGRNVALLFENVQGSEMPVLINAFGSPDRMAAALGVGHLDELSARVAKLIDLRMPGSVFDKLRKLGTLFDVVKAGPKRVSSAACQEVVETERPSLASLPVLRCWPGDGGRYITLPMVFTRDPVTGARNVGMYRLQVYDDQTLGMHWQIHKGSAEHQRLAEERKEPMEVAIALGGDPVRDLLGLRAPAARHRRDGLRGLAARLGRADGAVQDGARGRARRGRDRAGGLGGSGRAAARGALRRSHRLLLPGARLSGLPPARRSRAGGTRSTRPPSWAARPRRTTGWARPPSASSCRSSG